MDFGVDLKELDKRLVEGRGVIYDPDFGPVGIKVNARAVRFIARWKQGRVELTVPKGLRAKDVVDAWGRLRARVATAKPTEVAAIAPGNVFHFDGLDISIHRHEWLDYATINYGLPESRIVLGATHNVDEPYVQEMIREAMRKIAQKVAPYLLLNRAREVAAERGCKPKEFSISHGHKVLGSCRKDGKINLSYMLVFFPAEIRDYIICHELAHLQEFDHSPRFHELCNRYCNGREAELQSRMHQVTKKLREMRLM